VHEPPVQPDRCALSGNYRLESNPVRHDLSPLAAATGNRISRARYVGGATEFLKWWPNYGYTRRTVFGICALLKNSSHLAEKELVALDPANKPPLVAVVFLFASSRLRAEKKDLKKIL